MFCRWCGAVLPEGAAACPKCGKPTSVAGDVEKTTRDTVDSVIADATRAAKDITAAAAQLSEKLAARLRSAADDPKGSVSRAARRVARDLDNAREEIEKALRDL
jgi:hypothetical protein